MESRYLIDWFSLTSKILSPDDWVNLLGFHGLGLKEIRGVHGFPNRLYYDGVNINFGDRGDGWVSWLELCGQGCRVFESYGSGDWDGLIAYFLNHQDTTHLTRMDVAFDDVDTNFLDMDVLWRDAFEGEFVSKWRKGEVRHGLPKETGGRTVYHGSPSSDFLLRIYDKARERGFFDRHWTRVELQMRDERAAAFLNTPGSLRDNFLGVLRNYLRYVDDPGTDSNRWRWPMKSYWETFMDGAERIRLFDKPGVEYNISNLEAYVFGQAGASIYTYIKCLGWAKFWNQLREMKHHEERLNIRQRELIDEWTGKNPKRMALEYDEKEPEMRSSF